ncbi:hypothetical protein CLAFUW4_05457 [Fulvia fulva]|uniref:Uncharacterized protein n=1 Tax=Passalora fulva TaxID=5499 RepID=A0A9Q8LGT8_PASFU|nr:uncharacterized protein CLAFUR5_05600 [Fulvia fulva]KAK4623914.1 hypothetical protein CLAFUR4_05451 [Fulvia fulva]KAK4625792.1 hypothetical protein CLAFUR0_05459 [Fulvia fulva]UJO17376.1 hypothetical protein CLAFUR5_05600 [Fulvia fulva]WPV15225.1 hypothetical protein CLAFUW4_05457 [Fulvia fulva]WPV30404.1 hypothetical protein CLAFUW7_05455 [Fulvia fulva]
MSERSQEPDTIYRNLRLVTSWYNFFIFVVAPWLAYIWLIYTVYHLEEDTPIFSRAKLILAMFLLGAAGLAMYIRSQSVREQLQAKGYEQRGTLARALDLLFNLAIIVAGYFWLQRWVADVADTGEGEDVLFLYILFPLYGAIVWTGLVIVCTGPILWFTTRVR